MYNLLTLLQIPYFSVKNFIIKSFSIIGQLKLCFYKLDRQWRSSSF